jgi:hypothetical protein
MDLGGSETAPPGIIAKEGFLDAFNRIHLILRYNAKSDFLIAIENPFCFSAGGKLIENDNSKRKGL